MKAKPATVLTALIICFCQHSFGQIPDSVQPSLTPTSLYGTWHFIFPNQGASDTLSFSRKTNLPHGCGQSIEINANGEFADTYSGKCGNDPNLHHIIGKWKYNSETKIFEATLPICMKEKKYKIVSLTSDTLLFAKP
jgi:hypothetical protein